jgi:hypothetical protein
MYMSVGVVDCYYPDRTIQKIGNGNPLTSAIPFFPLLGLPYRDASPEGQKDLALYRKLANAFASFDQ